MDINRFIQSTMHYIDDDVIVMNKPSGLLSVPGKGHLTDCMIARLKQVHPEALLIHRLDRDTSGLLVFARHPAAQTHMSKQFAARETEKFYQALVVGRMPTSLAATTIDVPVRYDATRPPLHVADPLHPKPALTHVWVGDGFSTQGQHLTPVWLKPITGRSHQLRVHMQYAGYPIAGDPLYATQAPSPLTRLALHASVLEITHPTTLKRITLTCPNNFGYTQAFNTHINPQQLFTAQTF